jgi:hypothetical protein
MAARLPVRPPIRRALATGVLLAISLSGCGKDEPSTRSARSGPASLTTPPAAPGPSTGPTSTPLTPAAMAIEEPVQAPLPTPAIVDAVHALAEAKGDGKPMLAILIPDVEVARRPRALLLGTFIRDLSPENLAILALVRVACFRPADVELIAKGSTAAPSPFAVLVETDGGATAWTRVAWPVALDAPDALWSWNVGSKGSEPDRSPEDDGFWAVFTEIRRAVAGDAATIERRTAQARAVYVPGSAERAERAALGETESTADAIESAAGLLYTKDEDDSERAAELRGAVGRAARWVLARQAPRGTEWISPVVPLVRELPPSVWCGTRWSGDRRKPDDLPPLVMPPTPKDVHDTAAMAKWAAKVEAFRKELDRRSRVRAPPLDPPVRIGEILRFVSDR